MQVVYTIREYDHDDQEFSIIGVADSLESVDDMIEQYYGKRKELIKKEDIRDSGVEFISHYSIKCPQFGDYKVNILVESFNINKI
jgi:hypothetical protein